MEYTDEEIYNIEKASPTKQFLLKEWDKDAYEFAQSIIAFLQESFPQFKVYFIGSLALKLPGSNDVDMNVDCGHASAEELAEYANLISEKYGAATRVEPAIAQWVFTKDGVSVDIILYNNQFEGTDTQIAIHEKIKNSPELQLEYENIKREAHEKSERDYVRGKIQFFRKLV